MRASLTPLQGVPSPSQSARTNSGAAGSGTSDRSQTLARVAGSSPHGSNQDLSDAVSVYSLLFLGEEPPILGTECVPIFGCRENCAR